MDQLGQQDGFRSAQQVHDDLTASGTKVGLATVYRNLQALAESAQLDTLRADDGETLYRLCQQEAHHHHLICRNCGRVEEISPGQVEQWVGDVAKEHGFSQLTHSIEISGICANCQKLES